MWFEYKILGYLGLFSRENQLGNERFTGWITIGMVLYYINI